MHATVHKEIVLGPAYCAFFTNCNIRVRRFCNCSLTVFRELLDASQEGCKSLMQLRKIFNKYSPGDQIAKALSVECFVLCNIMLLNCAKPFMLLNLATIICSRISDNIYPLFLLYSHDIPIIPMLFLK